MIKSKINLLIVSTLIIMISCAPGTFYQVYKANPTGQISNNESSLSYEDEFCEISYNMWSDGGDIGFSFYNKTDKNIYLDLSKSFFVLNGTAFDYYKNRVFTESSSSGTTTTKTATASKAISGFNSNDLLQINRIQLSNGVGVISSSGSSVSYSEERVICIPSKTSKRIAEYSVNHSLYRDCDLFKYPTKKQINTKSFTKSESPFVFSNRLSYTIENSDDKVKIENEFYISEITNYPKNEIIESKTDKFCEQELMSSSEFFKLSAPNMFYIQYSKGQQDLWKH